jgi:hypothetical protein
LEIPRHIAEGSHAPGHSFAQLSWSVNPAKCPKWSFPMKPRSAPKSATGWLTRRLRLTLNLSTPTVFNGVRAQALLFNKMWYLDGDLLPHPLKFLSGVVISQTNHGTMLTNRGYSDDWGSLQMVTLERNGCAGICLF